MKTVLTICMATAVLTWGASNAHAQRGGRMPNTGALGTQGTINYTDLSKRNTQKSSRDDRKEKAAEEAKKKAEEEKRKAEREKRWGNRDGDNKGMTTTHAAGNTSGSKSARNQGPKRATQPIVAGGSSDPTMKDVTEVMLQAVKTQKVNFDPETAQHEPGIILLNSPKFDTTKRIRAGDQGIAAPL